MHIWKPATLILTLAIAGACSNSPDAETKTEETPGAASTTSTDSSSAPSVTDKSKAEAPKAIAPKAVKVPAGTALNVVLSTSLNSGKNKAGDVFTGNLAEDVVVDGRTVLAKGTKIEGKVVSAEGAGKVKGVGRMSLDLTSATVGGKSVALSTKAVAAEAQNTKGRDAAVIGGAAGVGAAIGAIAGGKKGAAIGAGVGGGAGTGTVLATKGKEVDYPAESKLEFTLDKDATL